MTSGNAPGRDFSGSERFEIVRQIGAGGIGVVYEARDRALGTHVALKTLQRLDGDGLLRFKKEFRLLQDLHHPNLVQLGELLEVDGSWFFTMELLDGVDLTTYVTGQPRSARARPRPSVSPMAAAIATETSTINELTEVTLDLRASRPPPPAPGAAGGARAHGFDEARLRETLRQLARGVDALHRAGMVHRDIKPHNVMVCSAGGAEAASTPGDPGRDRVVLLDFGMIGETHAWDDDAGRMVGTPLYMAPEQAAGATLPASDWYAVGVMLYEALTGSRPFEGNMAYVLMEKERNDPTPPSLRDPSGRIPPDLEALCMALLARDPSARPTGAEVLARLAGRTGRAARGQAARSEREVPLVGRAAEIGELRAAWVRSSPGRPVVALVHGTSGMGKTALVEHFARTLARGSGADTGALVLRGRCYEREDVPYKAFDGVVDSLSRYLKARQAGAAATGDDSRSLDRLSDSFSGGWSAVALEHDPALDAWLARELPWLARLFPVLERAADDSDVLASVSHIRDPRELRRRGFGALRSLLDLLAARRPVAVVIDDVQWGDRDSAALLAELLAPPAPPGVFFVITYRSEEAHREAVQALRTAVEVALPARSICEIEIGRLDEIDCHSLAVAIGRQVAASAPAAESGAGVLDALARIAAREAQGSPFFTGEMMRYLAAAGADAGITLDRVLLARYRQLDAEARALLEAVALAGRPVAQAVALRAAGLDGGARGPVNALRAGHFARTSGPGPEDAIEAYHDRIREAVAAELQAAGEDGVRARYRRLAEALEDSASDDVELRVLCYQGAGDPERAARWALRAAEQAERALAFDRAAQMIRLALSLERRPVRWTEGAPGDALGARAELDTRALQARLADALAHANRGVDAAGAYLDAADGAAPELALVLKRRAAEQLLRSGSMDRGIAVLREVLAASKLSVPRSNWRAVLSLLWRRLRLRLRGLRYRPRASIPRRERHLADVCWAGTAGLSTVDPIRGADFGTRLLLMALRQGDEVRIAQALAIEAGQRSIRGNKSGRQVAVLLRAVDDIARRLNQPYVSGAATLSHGFVAMLNGRWQEARRRGEKAERIFREQCLGVSWEIGSSQLFQFTGLYYLGEWRVLRERALEAARRARARNDLYALANLASFLAYSSLLIDDVAGARRAVEQIQGRWRLPGYHLQNYYQLLAHLQIDLYAGDAATGWERLERELPRLGRTVMGRVQLVRVVIEHTRARCALALAGSGHADAEQFLRAAERVARQIERERLFWGEPMAAAVRAGLAVCRGREGDAVAHLDRAIEGFDSADMLAFATAARLQQARLVGGHRGRDLLAEADLILKEQGFVDPDRLADMLVPGFRR